MQDALICAAKRTPIGSFGGVFSSQTAVSLASHAAAGALGSVGVPAARIDEIILGCVLTAGLGQAPARQVALAIGMSDTSQAMSVNKVCSSGLLAVMLAADAIALGRSQAILAGGMESMSNAPYYLPQLRKGARLGHAPANDSILTDGLWDPHNNFHMGNAAELCAQVYGIERPTQDAYAIQSYSRARKATAAGEFAAEIVPITLTGRQGEFTANTDEEPFRFDEDKISSLNPAFEKGGTITAANASSLNDGAAMLLVCSERFAAENNLKPLARIANTACFGDRPEKFTTAPVGAMQKLLANAGVGIEDVDLFEINEAFAVVSLACTGALGLHPGKVNVRGGAVALGHPIGASGARILVTLTHLLNDKQLRRGVAAICNGGGEATAMLIERT